MGHWPEPWPIHFLSVLRPQSVTRFPDFHITPLKAHKDSLYKQLRQSKKKIAEFTSEPFIMKIHPVRVYVTFQHQVRLVLYFAWSHRVRKSQHTS